MNSLSIKLLNDDLPNLKNNHFDTYEDYQFILDMFNKRKISDRQKDKMAAIILNSIKSFVQEKLKDKVRTR